MEQFFQDTIRNLESIHRDTEVYVRDRLSLCPSQPNGHELLKGLKIPYLRMDLPSFDARTMLQEAIELQSHAVPHRSKDSHGWKSLCIHGIEADLTGACKDYGYNDERETPYKWTWVHEQAPVTFQYLKNLENSGYFTELYRIRFMYLEPGGYIQFHQDRPDGRNSLGPLNIALNMPENCHWLFKKWGQVPFKEGEAYAVDISNQHGVWNDSNEVRVHIIVHGRYGEAYYETIERSTLLMKNEISADAPALPRVKKAKSISRHELACVVWENNTDVSDPDLFSTCCDLTEHFVRLRANRHIIVERGVSLKRQLEKALKRGAKWAVVVAPGTVLKDGFFQKVLNEINSVCSDTFLMGHILDRKERWYGLHPQCFVVDLGIWDRLGRPLFSDRYEARTPVVEPERSLENIHDDYTPVFLKPSNNRSSKVPTVNGWNWLDKGLKAGLKIMNFDECIRDKKIFLYPEQNEKELLLRLKNPHWSLDEMRELAPLSSNQEKDYEYFQMESSDLEDKVFLFNTERVRSDYVEYNLRPVDLYIGLPAGFMDAHILYRHKMTDCCRLLYYDVNSATLEFKKEMLQHWTGLDFPSFIEEAFDRFLFKYKNLKLTVDRDQFDSRWQKELELWGSSQKFQAHFQKIKRLPSLFERVNILEDSSPILELLKKEKQSHVALWYSNCFNYTPGLAKQGWSIDRCRRQGSAFLNQVYKIALNNKLRVTIYGEDINESAALDGFGVEIHSVFN